MLVSHRTEISRRSRCRCQQIAQHNRCCLANRQVRRGRWALRHLKPSVVTRPMRMESDDDDSLMRAISDAQVPSECGSEWNGSVDEHDEQPLDSDVYTFSEGGLEDDDVNSGAGNDGRTAADNSQVRPERREFMNQRLSEPSALRYALGKSRKVSCGTEKVLKRLRHRELHGPLSRIQRTGICQTVEHSALQELDLGEYVDLKASRGAVRSTISIDFAHDARFFASTHGDHTVKIFTMPDAKLEASLHWHQRTPWAVKFHPHNSDLLASGCLGNEVCIWSTSQRKCVRSFMLAPTQGQTQRASICSLSFHPDGGTLAIASGMNVYMWVDYMEPSSVPQLVHQGNADVRVVAFHPHGRLVAVGEKNLASSPTEQFTLRLDVRLFVPGPAPRLGEVQLTVPRAVAYNDAGLHFSPDGKLLAACVPCDPAEHNGTFQLSVFVVNADSLQPGGIGRGQVPHYQIGLCLYSLLLDAGHASALTNIRFSSSSVHVLAGFSFRHPNPILRWHNEHLDDAPALRSQLDVVKIFCLRKQLSMIRSLKADMDMNGVADEINVALFNLAHAGTSSGVLIYGTQTGRMRIFRSIRPSPSLANVPEQVG
ncbi:Activating molecule in BECN1-regulated autophagy protein 1 [Porphyridium purpureum]|uniref:Activating molecule in BECN1-regulated autophagy protein 1 n=1 Tax=Porphyridium purpureum TaxID=35688 RepID=A0A5J4YNA1_PORPP|nr:Activating molecule in BECN1-regulated autophagy protein 1 [Porphyridium purpureum]|eukprot:POR0509..scf222_8